ncbi:SurA N-terminal domain-containing protein [Neisseria sp. ZJ106]|uniref:Periplasmic chaperone PpiD n=1 Tax=Neisseria lisongii TaxID=2912188 RepID=A0ABY7RJ94_9NEIS|nr:SurA N-terminal domain-containing protein [Neisseria lisongii]MCF7521722.1 SurA N-terminal domain-containing protein [Neisseria lisongii]WCL70836.1 SurA N-terminal domain-containing protein [Neisseria lisongii]
MFHIVEKYKTPAQIILGLIGLTFVGFGVSTATAPGADYIVKIGSQKVSEHDINSAVQNMQGDGGQVSRDAVFQSLLQRAYLTQGAKLMGIAVSPEQIKQIIVDDPNFHDADGKFSQALLTQYLDQRRMSEDQFVEDIRQQFAFQNLLNLVQNGTLVSDAQAEQLLKIGQASRTVRVAMFNPEAFVSQVKTDDSALQAYYDAHKKDYLIPQAVKIEYVALNLKDIAAKQTVSEEEIRKAFDAQPAVPRRNVAHIFFPVAENADEATRKAVKAEADQVAAKAQAKPSEFAALAKKHSKDVASAANGGQLGWVEQNSGIDKNLENAAFALKKGGISGVVQSQSGYHIIQVLDSADKPVFEQDKARIAEELKIRKAGKVFNEAKEKLAEDAINHPESLKEAAKTLGVGIESSDEWLTQSGGEAAGMPKELIAAVFSDDVLKKKYNSEPVSVNPETVWVVRAKEVRQEKTAPFTEVKDNVRQNYLRSESYKLAEKKAQETLAAVKGGKADAAAWGAVEELNAQQVRAMPPQAAAQLVKARPAAGKPAYVLLEGLPLPALVEVQKITAPENLTQMLPAAKQELVQQQSANVFEQLLHYLQKQIKQEQGMQKVNSEQ